MFKIIMPQLGQTMEQGTITRWLKNEGDRVEKGEMLFEITTDKATVEAESFGEGILRKILVKENETVPVLSTIAIIAAENENIEEVLTEFKKETLKKEETKQEVKQEIFSSKNTDTEGQIRISPIAKKLAKEKNIDISKIKFTGERITEADVLNFIKNEEVDNILLTGNKKIVADRMILSKTTIPHFYLIKEVDMENVIEFKNKLIEKQEKVSFNDIIIKITSLALKKYPQMNAIIINNRINIFNEINIGIAVDNNDNLIVPVLKNVEQKNLFEISKEVKNLVYKIENKKILPSDLENASFTITNLGSYGIDNFIPIINPPQVAIMAISSIIAKAVVINDKIDIRRRMNITLSCDHRAINGVYATKFLNMIQEILKNPEIIY